LSERMLTIPLLSLNLTLTPRALPRFDARVTYNVAGLARLAAQALAGRLEMELAELSRGPSRGSRRTGRWRRASSPGQALVELSLILPVLLIILVCCLDLGRAYFAYVGILAAAEQGARAASDLRFDGTAINNAVKLESGGSLAISDADITVSCPLDPPAIPTAPESCRQRGRAVTVSVRRTFTAVNPLLRPIAGTNSIPLHVSASVVVP
jgi:hypothetical protein